MKKTYSMKNIRKINEMAEKMPKTINEMLEFEGEDMDFEDDTEEMDKADDEPVAQKPANENIDVASFVDDIRKKSLKGMAQLAESPESPEYQLLKKIWQICDKKPEDQVQKPNAL